MKINLGYHKMLKQPIIHYVLNDEIKHSNVKLDFHIYQYRCITGKKLKVRCNFVCFLMYEKFINAEMWP